MPLTFIPIKRFKCPLIVTLFTKYIKGCSDIYGTFPLFLSPGTKQKPVCCTRVIFRVTTIYAPCPSRWLTLSFWTSRAVSRTPTHPQYLTSHGVNCMLCHSALSITNSISCEMCPVITFLNAEIIHPAKIHCQFVDMYGKSVMNEGNVRKCHLFNVRNERW